MKVCCRHKQLVMQSNPSRLLGNAVTEFSRPLWSGSDQNHSPTRDNEPSVPTNSQKMSVTEVRGDLFTSPDSLVHCVSQDLHMGKGIATEFKKRFGGVEELRRQNIGIGEVGVLWRGNRYIYYLVTKDRYYHKPTLGNLRHSLHCTMAHCQQHGIKRIAMPRIGCGLDKLNWSDVLQIIDEIFISSGIHVMVFSL